MFDIGFWEILVIAVVALLVVGPNEFPVLVRTIGVWIGKIRRFMAETKNDLDLEFRKAEELKQLMEREASLAELHEQVDARKIEKGGQHADKRTGTDEPGTQASVATTVSEPAAVASPATAEDPARSSSASDHSSTRSSHGSSE